MSTSREVDIIIKSIGAIDFYTEVFRYSEILLYLYYSFANIREIRAQILNPLKPVGPDAQHKTE